MNDLGSQEGDNEALVNNQVGAGEFKRRKVFTIGHSPVTERIFSQPEENNEDCGKIQNDSRVS